MPTIRAKPGKWSDLIFAIFQLWLNPDSIKSARTTFRDMHGHAAYAVREKFGPDKIKLSEKDITALYKADPQGVRLPGTIQSTMGQGILAGAILWNVLRIADQFGDRASVELGMRATQAMAAKDGASRSRASMMAAWSRYRGVSHFFAAIFQDPRAFKTMGRLMGLKVSKRAMANSPDDKLPITAKEVGRMLADLPAFVAGLQKIGREVMPRYIAIAERFRELGEKYYAPRQKQRGKPLLDPKIMWRVPRGFKLPPVQIAFKRLNNAERAAMTSKVGSKRRLDSMRSSRILDVSRAVHIDAQIAPARATQLAAQGVPKRRRGP